MSSYWIDSISQTRKTFPVLKTNEKTDVCIIGGGITGLTTAYYLSKSDLNVILLEKSQLCNHTTRKLNCKNN